jgi:trk system potassium uptake protein TrkH
LIDLIQPWRRARRARPRPPLGIDVLVALDLVGAVLKWLALAFAAPIAVALANGESALPFLISGLALGMVGLVMDRVTPDRSGLAFGPREAFLVVALLWVLVPAFGALPFLLGGVKQLSDPVGAYFESMSGFTTTGATVLTHIDALGQGMLFWRQLTHWLGGMGIIILALAVLPRLRVGGRQLFQNELQGPSETEPLGAHRTRAGPSPVEGVRGRERHWDTGPACDRVDRSRSGYGPV